MPIVTSVKQTSMTESVTIDLFPDQVEEIIYTIRNRYLGVDLRFIDEERILERTVSSIVESQVVDADQEQQVRLIAEIVIRTLHAYLASQQD